MASKHNVSAPAETHANTYNDSGNKTAPAGNQGLTTATQIRRLQVAENKSNVPTSVYRFYDENDLLLYVGITSRRVTRQYEHNSSKDWWKFVKRQEVEHYPSRREAMSRERGLITRFRPPFNTQHNPDHEAVREAYLSLAVNERGEPQDLAQILSRGRSKTTIAMKVEPVGNQLRLTSEPGEAQKLINLNPDDLDNVVIECHTRRKARSRAHKAYIKNGMLVVIVTQRYGAVDSKSATVLLRQPNGRRRYASIKRIDLYGEAKRPEAA